MEQGTKLLTCTGPGPFMTQYFRERSTIVCYACISIYDKVTYEGYTNAHKYICTWLNGVPHRRTYSLRRKFDIGEKKVTNGKVSNRFESYSDFNMSQIFLYEPKCIALWCAHHFLWCSKLFRAVNSYMFWLWEEYKSVITVSDHVIESAHALWISIAWFAAESRYLRHAKGGFWSR